MGVEAPRQDTGSPGVRYAKLQQEEKKLVPKESLLEDLIRALSFSGRSRWPELTRRAVEGVFWSGPQLAARGTLRRALHRERDLIAGWAREVEVVLWRRLTGRARVCVGGG
jgi:hypothetical protein